MELAKVFQSHMILQREKRIIIHGTGKGAAKIVFAGVTRETVSDADTWSVTFPEMAAGGPYTMEVTLDGKTQEFEDVLIGEVFLCGGQSNMALPLSMTMEQASYAPDIRFYQANVEYENRLTWMTPSPENRDTTSALCMHFAWLMHKEYGVPVGILSINQGSSRMQSWIDADVLHESDCVLPDAWQSDEREYTINADGYLYENQLMTAAPYTVRAVLWYQGESNGLRYEVFKFEDIFRLLTECWRDAMHDPELPFFTTSLAPYIFQSDDHDEFGGVRLAQLRASRSVPNVYFSCIADLGEYGNIHPYRKQAVARRLFLSVQHHLFGRTDLEWSGPVFDKMEVSGGDAIISFTHDTGLFCADKEVNDLWVAEGENTGVHNEDIDTHTGIVQNEKFVPAHGKIEDGKLIVHADGVIPRVVKFNYHCHTFPNIFNAAGLPAATFRATEKGLTEPVVTVF